MDDPPPCPDYWPRFVWYLHFLKVPFKRPVPVNYPPPLDEIFSLIAQHTLTYLQADQKGAQVIRLAAQKRILELVPQMGGHGKIAGPA